MPNIVVIGAGVSGLTSALLLARSNKANKVTVVARHMPGDYDIEYTSPWAGANVLPMNDEANSRWERETWPEMKRLAAEVPEAGIHFQKARLWRRKKDVEAQEKQGGSLETIDPLYAENPWFRELFDDYRELDESELPPDIASGAEWTSVCINTMLYLPWLVGQCRALGVVFRRAVLEHIDEAASYAGLVIAADGKTQKVLPSSSQPVIVVNCSGLLACRLGGVADAAVKPARGQVVVVRNELTPMMVLTGTDDNPDECFYSMMRAVGGGTIIGGTYQIGRWESQPDPNIAARIVARAAAVHPQLRDGQGTAADLDVIRHGVGLRPYREGGVRLERETRPLPGGQPAGGSPSSPLLQMHIVHNYGHAGWGYQGSYGCAKRVVELVDEIAAELLKARL